MVERGDSDMNQLGLEGWAQVDERFVAFAPDPVGQGRGVSAAAVSFADEAYLQSLTSSFARLPIPELEERGAFVSVPRGRRVLRVVGAERIATVPVDPSLQVEDAESGGVLIDFAAARALFVLRGDVAVRIEPAEDGVQLGLLKPEPALYVATPPLPMPHLEQWAEAQGDRWLAAQLERTLARGDAWSIASAVGMYARLLEPSAEKADEAVRAALAGQTPAHAALPRQYALSLQTIQLEQVTRLALVKVEGLMHALDALPQGAASAAERAALLELAERREEIEWGRTTLRFAGAADTLTTVVAAFDEDAVEWTAGAPLTFEEVSKREPLRRAGLRDPWAWWLGGGKPELGE
ncbi:MAG TPA: hypothetical protein PKG80_07895 [Acidobacteriota bacterium]|nr:hypothetical protein [Acidobacteriota bacterium]